MKPPVSVSRLLSCLYRHTQMYFDQRLKSYDIGYGALAFLMMLYHHDGIHQEEISRKLHIDKATTARAIHKLETGGYIRREPDIADRRAYRIFVMDKALRLKPELHEFSKEWTQQLMADFSVEEQAQAFILLDKMAVNARAFRSRQDVSG